MRDTEPGENNDGVATRMAGTEMIEVDLIVAIKECQAVVIRPARQITPAAGRKKFVDSAPPFGTPRRHPTSGPPFSTPLQQPP